MSLSAAGSLGNQADQGGSTDRFKVNSSNCAANSPNGAGSTETIEAPSATEETNGSAPEVVEWPSGPHAVAVCDVADRVRVDGKFFAAGDERFLFRGVTYGTFAPRSDGALFPCTVVDVVTVVCPPATTAEGLDAVVETPLAVRAVTSARSR